MGPIGRAFVLFPVLFGFYLFLAGEISAVEVTAAAFCATAGTGFAAALTIVAKRHYRISPPAKAVLAPFAALIPEYFVVLRELVSVAIGGTKRQRGAFVSQPFEPGGFDPASAGRRAVAIMGISLAPRTFTIRGEMTDTLLLHGFPPKAPSDDRRWPG